MIEAPGKVDSQRLVGNRFRKEPLGNANDTFVASAICANDETSSSTRESETRAAFRKDRNSWRVVRQSQSAGARRSGSALRTGSADFVCAQSSADWWHANHRRKRSLRWQRQGYARRIGRRTSRLTRSAWKFSALPPRNSIGGLEPNLRDRQSNRGEVAQRIKSAFSPV